MPLQKTGELTETIDVTIDPASVAADTSAEQTFTVVGLEVGMVVAVAHGGALLAGLGIAGVRVSAQDTLAITFINATAGALDQASSVWSVIIISNPA